MTIRTTTEGLARNEVISTINMLKGFHPPVPMEGLITFALSQVRDDRKHRVPEVRALEADGKMQEALDLAVSLA